MVALGEIARFLDRFFAVGRYGEDQGGIWRPSDRPVRRLGLAIEPWPGIGAWATGEGLDALFVHRPWRLPPDLLDVGTLAYHLAFDERLTTGHNPRLAEALGMAGLQILGHKEGRPLGMIGAVAPQGFDELTSMVEGIFGGREAAHAGAAGEVRRVAVVGAMTDALVREAAARGADVYLTGQWRRPADAAVAETGIGVVAIGHRRSEEWGLRALAGVLRERWAGLTCVLPPNQEGR